jgi:hypothetical protein
MKAVLNETLISPHGKAMGTVLAFVSCTSTNSNWNCGEQPETIRIKYAISP